MSFRITTQLTKELALYQYPISKIRPFVTSHEYATAIIDQVHEVLMKDILASQNVWEPALLGYQLYCYLNESRISNIDKFKFV